MEENQIMDAAENEAAQPETLLPQEEAECLPEEGEEARQNPNREEAGEAEQRIQAMQAGADAIYEAWQRQAEEAREVYPELDMAQELKNPKFVELLRGRVDVRSAYETVHMQEILPAAMEYAARMVEEKLASSLYGAGNRPSENGIGAQGAVLLARDPARISREDYADICSRVARGERISFG